MRIESPHAVESEAAEPEAVEPEVTEPGTIGPETNEPGTGEPELGEHAIEEPAAAEPEAEQSEAVAAPLGYESLIPPDESARFHEQIHQIQGMFVDDPRQSVRDADHLLEDIVRSLASGLEERRRALTPLWGGDESGTEQLRQALRSYRSLAVQLLGPEN